MTNGSGYAEQTHPDQKQATQRFTWPVAFVAALFLHAVFVVFSPDEVLPLLLPPPEQPLEVQLLDVEDEDMPNREPGGGSPTPGVQEVAKASPPVVPVRPPAKVVPKTPLTPKPVEELVHPKVAEQLPEPPAVEAPDPLLSDAFDEPSTFALPKPKAVRTTLARKAELLQRDVEASALAKSRDPAGSTHVGSVPGKRGGPGGAGQGNGRVVKEKFAFGGPEGAFQADVCALPRGTASIGLVADCPHLLTFFADRINVAARHFRQGFPGIEERVEWFGIKYTGQFKVEDAGVYEFRLSSDDGSRLIIDETLVINNDGTHAPLSRSGRIHLAAGTHQLKLLYFQGPGTLLALQLFVTPPGRREKTFRPEF